MKIKHLQTWTYLGMAALVVGCSGGGSSSSSSSTTTGTASSTSSGSGSGTTIKLDYIGKAKENPVFPAGYVGAEDAAKEISKMTGDNVTVTNDTPDQESGQDQANRIHEAANQGDTGIMISCSDANADTPAINDAVSKGLAVMTFDSDAVKSKRFGYYGTDDKECGIEVMDGLAKVLNGKGTIAILAGSQQSPNLQIRVKSVEEEAKKFPGIKVLGAFNHEENPQAATAEVQQVMQQNPNINGWAMIGGWPLFAKGLLADLDPNKVKIVSVDALPQELAYVDKGIAPLLLAQPVYDWGYISTYMLYEKLKPGNKDVEAKLTSLIGGTDVDGIHPMKLVPVTKDTLSQWADQLYKWKFTFSKDEAKYLPPADQKAAGL